MINATVSADLSISNAERNVIMPSAKMSAKLVFQVKICFFLPQNQKIKLVSQPALVEKNARTDASAAKTKFAHFIQYRSFQEYNLISRAMCIFWFSPAGSANPSSSQAME